MIKKLFYIIAIFSSFCLAEPNRFTAGPYLLDVKTDSAIVAFHLDNPLAAKVKVYNGDQVKEFTSKTESKSHFIKVSNLKPGLVYNYQVICGNGEIQTPADDVSYQIKTACRAGESFSFVVYGDTRPGDNKTDYHHRQIIEQIIQQEPSFAIVLGDMVDDGANPQLWQKFLEIESGLLRRAAIYPILGDNDFANGKGLYLNYFPLLSPGYYRFEWGGVQFFGLNAWGGGACRAADGRRETRAPAPRRRPEASRRSPPRRQARLFGRVPLEASRRAGDAQAGLRGGWGGRARPARAPAS
jgi:hypothetical protein